MRFKPKEAFLAYTLTRQYSSDKLLNFAKQKMVSFAAIKNYRKPFCVHETITDKRIVLQFNEL